MERKELIDTVNKAKGGSREAREILYKEYYRDVLYICKKYGLTTEEAEDVTQDSFIKAFENLSSLHKSESFGAWISRIASNTCLNHIKHNSIIQMNSMDDEDIAIAEIPANEKNAQDIVEDKEVSDILQKLIYELSQEQKLAVFMYYYQDYSISEIAKELNCPKRTIRSRLDYAKKHMRKKVKAMENEGIKLRSVAVSPLLYALFSEEKKAFASNVATISDFTGVSGALVNVGTEATTNVTSLVVETVSKAKIAGMILGTVLSVVFGGAFVKLVSFIQDEKSYVKEYDKRMASYIEYFDNYKQNYDYNRIAIALDKNSLPVMWVCSYNDRENYENPPDYIECTARLISYKDDEATSLGEVEFSDSLENGLPELAVKVNDEGVLLVDDGEHIIYFDEEEEELLCTLYEQEESHDYDAPAAHNIYECFGMMKNSYVYHHTRIINALNTSYLVYFDNDKQEVSCIAKRELGKKGNDINFLQSMCALEVVNDVEPYNEHLYVLADEYKADKGITQLFSECFETDVYKIHEKCRNQVTKITDDIMELGPDGYRERVGLDSDSRLITNEIFYTYFNNVGIGHLDDLHRDDVITFADGTDESELDIDELVNLDGRVSWTKGDYKFFEEEQGMEYLKFVKGVKPRNGGELTLCTYKVNYDVEIIPYDDELVNRMVETVHTALKQIEDKKYALSIVARGIPEERIRKYGFAFEGKKVMIG